MTTPSPLRRLVHRMAPLYQSNLFVPFIVCAVIVVATVLGSHQTRISLQHDVRTAAEARAAGFESLITTQLGSYEQILRGGVGLFQGSDNVTSSDFTNFMSTYDLGRNYPAVQAIAFAKVFTNDQLPDLQDYLTEEGVTSFSLRPLDAPRDVYAAAIYIQVVASTNKNPVTGYDSYSDPLRKAAMLQARDTAKTTMTSSINLMPLDATAQPVPGFNLYLPYYGPQIPATIPDRQAEIRGYVYAAFRGQVFFQDVTARSDSKTIAFQVMADSGGEQTTLFQSDNFAERSHEVNAVKLHHDFHAYNQTWRINYALQPSSLVSEIQLRRPGAVLFFGFFSAVLITTIIGLTIASRARALQVQREQDVELAKDELLSLASHQLRTPATGVEQYLGMVLQGFAGNVPRQQQQLLEKAYSSNDRQLQLINDILHMAKINAGHIVLARQTVNLTNMVRDIVQEQQQDIKAARHKVKLVLGKRPVSLYVDPHMLRMATENILSNAIKYTPHGGRITVKLTRQKDVVEIQVEDNGVGIDQGDFPKLFKQFSRLPNAQHVSGTGVGLYLAKNLVELHGGTINVTSAPGKGSTFTIWLPIDRNMESV